MKKIVLVSIIVFLTLVSLAAAECGDGRINGNEQCDGLDLDGSSCASFNYSAGHLTCNSSCQIIKSSCFNLEESTCHDILSDNLNVTCAADPEGGFNCVGTQGDVNAKDLCAHALDLTVLSPQSGVYQSRDIPLQVQTLSQAHMSYSLDGKNFKTACSSCTSIHKNINFRYGPHSIQVKADYVDGPDQQETIWFNVARPMFNKPGETFWYGNSVFGSFAQGYSEFKVVETTNHPQPDIQDTFVNTNIRIAAKNLPKINNNEEYVLWLYKSNTTNFLKLGKLNVNKKSAQSEFSTGIIGYFQDNNYHENVLDHFDAAFIEVEDSHYALPYPNTESILTFNKPFPRNFLENGTACINGRQCESGFCHDGVCD